MKELKTFIILFLLILSLNFVNAQEINIIKETKNEISLGDNILVKISFKNPYDRKATFEVQENLPQGITSVNPEEAETELHNGIEVKSYKWIVEVNPNNVVTINYAIRPNNLGVYALKPTIVKDTTTGEIQQSDLIEVLVRCIGDNICDSTENSLTCPEDCSLGIQDNICNYGADGICDIDCEEDPDCGSNKTWTITILIILVIIITSRIILKKRKTQEAA